MYNFNVTVNKGDLLAIIKKNRTSHQELFDEALAGWHAQCLAEVGAVLEALQQSTEVKVSLRIPRPTDHTGEYDTIISMLERSISDEVTIDTQTYRQFVEDEWEWKQSWLIQNSVYSGAVKAKADLY